MKIKLKNTWKTYKKAVIRGIYFILPFAFTGGVLVSLSYITDLISGGDAIYGLGSTNPIAVMLKSIGSLVFTLMLPVLSSVIAVEISEQRAFLAGLAGGYLAQSGATLLLPYGDTTSISGFIGALGAGLIAGTGYRLISKLILRNSKVHIMKNAVIPLLSVVFTALIMLSINPIIGSLNLGISALLMLISTKNAVVFGVILGVMTAIDLGGAFGKAAYIFATAAIASGEYTAMAAVMSASMSVPLSIALSAEIFKMKYSKKEAQLAKANLLFGLCNITEGAIPIAAKDPARVVPCIVAGAAVSGGLSAGFGCTLIAPYGGLLVIPLVGKPLMFIISVLTGTLVSTVILGIVKREPKTRFTTPATVKIKSDNHLNQKSSL